MTFFHQDDGDMMDTMIIRPGALGDTLMLMPSLVQLADAIKITVVGRTPGIDFLRPYACQCIDFERAGWHDLFIENAERPFSMIHANRVIAFVSRHAEILKKNLLLSMPDSRVHIFPGLPPGHQDFHTAFYLARCLEETGLPLDAEQAIHDACNRPLLYYDPAHHQVTAPPAVSNKGQSLPSPLAGSDKMVLHPGSGSVKKNYDPAFWIHFIRKYLTSIGGVVLLLGPAEQSFYPFYVDRLKKTGVEIVFSPEKEKLMSLLARAPLYIGHDSGITHLAAMLGRPTFAVFKDSSVVQWRPLGPMVRVFQSPESESHLLDNLLNNIHEFV